MDCVNKLAASGCDFGFSGANCDQCASGVTFSGDYDGYSSYWIAFAFDFAGDCCTILTGEENNSLIGCFMLETLDIIQFKWVSGTRGPSQIRTDLTDPTHGPNGSIRIGELRTHDICKLRI